MMKVYLASPFDAKTNKKNNALCAKEILSKKGLDVYCPWEHKIPNDWDYPNTEWGLMVFTSDINAIQESDIVVVLSYGRESTAGTNWEAGYAYGIGKKVIVVEVSNPSIMSLMVSNGRYATVQGFEGLEDYDFQKLPKLRTFTEQK